MGDEIEIIDDTLEARERFARKNPYGQDWLRLTREHMEALREGRALAASTEEGGCVFITLLPGED